MLMLAGEGFRALPPGLAWRRSNQTRRWRPNLWDEGVALPLADVTFADREACWSLGTPNGPARYEGIADTNVQ